MSRRRSRRSASAPSRRCRAAPRSSPRWRKVEVAMSFLPSPGVLSAFCAAGVLLAATPGPDMALFLSRTLGGGRAHGMAALLVHTCAAALGLSALLAASTRAYDAVKIAGALYLLYLAYGALRHGSA